MTDSIEVEAATLRALLVERMQTAGHAQQPDVAEAFRQEPRHVYAPRFTRSRQNQDGAWTSDEVTRDDPNWLTEVYTDQVLLTSAWPNPLSSSTVPSLMADMHEALDVSAGTTVIEIGTGTGYNAALLGRLVGDENVVTVDVASELVDAARGALDAAGHAAVTVVLADGGSRDVLRHGSADRLIATCAVDRIPDSWRLAVCPGGRIVAPLGAGVAVLDIAEDRSAEGRFLPTGAYFMQLRAPGGDVMPTRPTNPDGPAEPCGMPPSAWDDTGFSFLVSLSLSSDDVLTDTPEVGELVIWHRDGSIAHIFANGTARQAGPRRLADLLAGLWQSYAEQGEPMREAYRIAIDADGEHTIVVEADGRVWPVRAL
ncbi:methyltransferase domain-containing protein [Yinghuangia sp. ASG 101]|uniref:methyltransferase domain-containing protein n=1 Tax=Yinghuangia sp. ASG 101 TaxID=2896848 RepID=UPI001E42B7E0|nr:methyltransferase domain-containing protein [Yinghuangia sp. ASG 101]UGQ09515.1 methyltransferase domain-containing protein [Yinghuangia sp. ASG 101]